MKKRKTSICFLLPISFLFAIQDLQAQLGRTSQQTTNCVCPTPVITAQPVSPWMVCAGTGTVTFTVGVTGTGTLNFQWKENGIVIADVGYYSGVHTATLTITSPGMALNGRNYQCVITNCAGHSVSTNCGVVLSLQSISGDINEDGTVNNSDFALMNLVYNTACSNCPEDLIPDGFIDVKDFLQLLGRYNMTCQ
ncbi:MAG: hypothetical protein ABI763_11335 [Bacteroidota bacterium]